MDGWILEFFNWYFDKYMINDVEANKEKFACDFPEINDILHFIESMLKLKYILQLFDRDYTLVCAGCENAGQI